MQLVKLLRSPPIVRGEGGLGTGKAMPYTCGQLPDLG
jgi:hypothetical protein